MIETRNLVHRYGDDGPAAVDGVSLSIADAEFVLLAGPNGSGKSTLVRHFNGLLAPDEGDVLVDDTPVGEDLVAARTKVGMVFQQPRDGFVAATVGADVAFGPENLGLAHDEIDRRVEAALAAVNMADRREERIDELSGGERERVAIAGALAMEPDHLVLDEPFTGLDAPARESVVDQLRALGESGTGVVLVTHDLRDAVDLADRVVALADGRVAADGTPDEARDRLPDLGIRVPPRRATERP
ncbi:MULTISPECIES: energy-coupling factor ABC transporter ATP-binding protein [Halorussus]|uniref:energy-coupling factor ABC transporter ATP-binding protein n=1 Tax=Halorussus TaxID=1070314 RepID=UPI000E21933C|nr:MULTISPECIES: ATP-binding cassette domain-containing protein [Halorussus]NHN60633.1 ATP-binding cassette domain-containing protein [Halorussus sp. JP-T4]